jgi:hypothetical protein
MSSRADIDDLLVVGHPGGGALSPTGVLGRARVAD